MANPSVVQHTSGFLDLTGTLTVSLSTAPVDTHQLVTIVTVSGATGTGDVTAPAGWTEPANATWPLNVYSHIYVYAFEKQAASSEPTSYDFTIVNGSGGTFEFVEIKDQDTSSWQDANPVQTPYPVSGTTPNIKGITTATNGALVWVYEVVQGSGAVSTPPTSLTLLEQNDVGSSVLSDTQSTLTQATAGVTRTFVFSTPTGYPTYGGVTLAFKPSSGTPTTVNFVGTSSSTSTCSGTLTVTSPSAPISVAASSGMITGMTGSVVLSGVLPGGYVNFIGTSSSTSACSGVLTVIAPSVVVNFTGTSSSTSACSGTLTVTNPPHLSSALLFFPFHL